MVKKSKQRGLFASSEQSMADNNGKTLSKAWRDLAKLLSQVGDARLYRSSGPEELEKKLKAVPESALLTAEIDRLREATEQAIKKEKRRRVEDFRRAEAVFINNLKKCGVELKEFDSSWRIGSLQLEVDRELSRVRVLYNREEVIRWKTISVEAEFRKLFDEGNAKLEEFRIEDQLLVDSLWDACRALRDGRKMDGKAKTLVPILDLYPELRITLVRQQLGKGNPGKKLKYMELPKWALLYNLDCYLALPSSIKSGKTIAFTTGSQVQHSSGLTLGGLQPRNSYKVFCFVDVPERD